MPSTPAFYQVISLHRPAQMQLFQPPPANFCSCHVSLRQQGHPSGLPLLVHSMVFWLTQCLVLLPSLQVLTMSPQCSSLCVWKAAFTSLCCSKSWWLLVEQHHHLPECTRAVPAAAAIPQPRSSASFTPKNLCCNTHGPLSSDFKAHLDHPWAYALWPSCSRLRFWGLKEELSIWGKAWLTFLH